MVEKQQDRLKTSDKWRGSLLQFLERCDSNSSFATTSPTPKRKISDYFTSAPKSKWGKEVCTCWIFFKIKKRSSWYSQCKEKWKWYTIQVQWTQRNKWKHICKQGHGREATGHANNQWQVKGVTVAAPEMLWHVTATVHSLPQVPHLKENWLFYISSETQVK